MDAMQTADKRKTLWLTMIASALLFCQPALASSHGVSHLENRAELSAENGQFSTERPSLTPETASSYYDPFREVASDSPVAPRSGVDVGDYRHVKGHHVHAKAGFKGHGTYNPRSGFSVSQDYMQSRGWSHQKMTAKQRELFDELARSGRPNTLKEHTRIAVEALVEGGASRAEARRLVAESLRNLRAQGVRVPSSIPWN